jgi:DNA invertase Pin-like site-specific DNA recombinase
MNKISADHLGRTAYVYVRQSTMAQVQHNHESQRRQYSLRERARLLGWQDVTVVDDDLGRSGSGVARPGFDRLLTAVGRGEVGAVFAIEASRLARNGRDWHTLLEFCAIVGTLIIDEDGIYDPRSSNDQMVLGLKGTFSVMESSAIRQRAFQAKLEKAARGELFGLIAVGYVLDMDDRLVKDPNERTREAVGLVFSKFRELGSVRQVALWLRRENVCLPKLTTGGPRRSVEWMLPTYSGLLNMLANPVYAGTYAYGRNGREIKLEDGRRRVRNGVRLPREKWRVLLHDRHEGYIDWAEFERNQRVIARGRPPRAPSVPGRHCCQACCDAVIVDASSRSVTAAINQGRNTIADGRSRRTTPAKSAEPSAANPLTAPSARRFCGSWRHSGSRRPWLRSKADRIATRIYDDKPSWRSKQLVMRRGWRTDSTMPSIPTTDWWRENWSGAGTNDWRQSNAWRRN